VLLTVSSAAFRRSFEFDARVPAGIEGVTVAMDWVEKQSEIPETNQKQNFFLI